MHHGTMHSSDRFSAWGKVILLILGSEEYKQIGKNVLRRTGQSFGLS